MQRQHCAPPKPRTCTPRRQARALATYTDVVDHYIANMRGPAAEELDFFANLTLKELIERVSFAENSGGKRHSHHQRRTQATLKAVHRRLIACHFKNCKSFDELLDFLRETIGYIGGVGPLFIYDAALHIGAYRNLYPKKVHLHTGTRIGAAAIGLGIGRDELEPGELPAAFRRLQPYEIEDSLCIYKRDLARIYAKR